MVDSMRIMLPDLNISDKDLKNVLRLSAGS